MATDLSLPVFVITDVTINAVVYKLPIFQTGKTVKLKLAVTPFTEYNGTEDGTTGIYKFENVEDGKYHKLVNGVQSGTFGVTNGRFIADDNMAAYAKLAGGNSFTGNQSLNGILSIPGGSNFLDVEGNVISGGVLVGFYPIIDTDSPWYTAGFPGTGNGLVWSSYLEARLAALSINPFQESSQKVRCIPRGSTEVNKVYRDLKSCTLSFASPTINNPCIVELAGSDAAVDFTNMNLNTMRDYVNFTSCGKQFRIVMRDGATNAKICTYERCTIIFGAIDFTGDREYSNKTFIDCDIYAYKNTTYNNCKLIRCRFLHASSFQAKLKGTTSAEGCGFNNEPDYSQLSDPGTVSGSYFIKLTSMPADVSSVEIPT